MRVIIIQLHQNKDTVERYSDYSMADLVCAHLTRSRTSLDTWTPLGQLKRPCMTFCIILRVKTPGCPCSCSNRTSPQQLARLALLLYPEMARIWILQAPELAGHGDKLHTPAMNHKIQAGLRLSTRGDVASMV